MFTSFIVSNAQKTRSFDVFETSATYEILLTEKFLIRYLVFAGKVELSNIITSDVGTDKQPFYNVNLTSI